MIWHNKYWFGVNQDDVEGQCLRYIQKSTERHKTVCHEKGQHKSSSDFG